MPVTAKRLTIPFDLADAASVFKSWRLRPWPDSTIVTGRDVKSCNFRAVSNAEAEKPSGRMDVAIKLSLSSGRTCADDFVKAMVCELREPSDSGRHSIWTKKSDL